MVWINSAAKAKRSAVGCYDTVEPVSALIFIKWKILALTNEKQIQNSN